jgi:hypothetical protein
VAPDRDVDPDAQQWRIGGGPADINHSRILDVAYPNQGQQRVLLSGYPAVPSGSIDDLGPDDYPLVPTVTP